MKVAALALLLLALPQDLEVREALRRIGKGDVEGGIAVYTRLLQDRPEAVEIHVLRGMARLTLRDYRGAIADADAAIAAKVRLPDAHAIRAAARKNTNDDAGAIEDATAALKLDPLHLESRLTRGLARYNLHQYIDAGDDAAKILEQNPKEGRAYLLQAGCFRERRKYAESVQAYTRALKLEPGEPFILVSRAAARYDAGDPIGAIEDCDRAFERRPADPDALWQKGLALIALRRWKEALAAVEGAMKDGAPARDWRESAQAILSVLPGIVSTESAEPPAARLRAAARALRAGGKELASVAILDEVVRLDPADVESHEILAVHYFKDSERSGERRYRCRVHLDRIVASGKGLSPEIARILQAMPSDAKRE